jgi:hypothetical protein
MTGQYEKFFHGYLPCSTFKINLNWRHRHDGKN